MEFEANAPTSNADRQRAETKKLTLQPLHSNITPDDLVDSEIAARHIVAPAIANVSNDTEESAAYIIPTKSLLEHQTTHTTRPQKLVAGITLGAILFIGLTILAVVK